MKTKDLILYIMHDARIVDNLPHLLTILPQINAFWNCQKQRIKRVELEDGGKYGKAPSFSKWNCEICMQLRLISNISICIIEIM